jgi:hypothetical protein
MQQLISVRQSKSAFAVRKIEKKGATLRNVLVQLPKGARPMEIVPEQLQ